MIIPSAVFAYDEVGLGFHCERASNGISFPSGLYSLACNTRFSYREPTVCGETDIVYFFGG